MPRHAKTRPTLQPPQGAHVSAIKAGHAGGIFTLWRHYQQAIGSPGRRAQIFATSLKAYIEPGVWARLAAFVADAFAFIEQPQASPAP